MRLQSIRNLGGGGFGTVDLVQDEYGSLYARKTFSVSHTMPMQMIENVKKRFVREARIQSGIVHQNIVRVLYADVVSDPPYYLMPPAECSLQDDLSMDRSIGGHWLYAISNIVDALEELHRTGIYHRDLKPQNVLKYIRIGNNGPEYYYAISDFGLIALNETRVSLLTMTGMAKGTDYYTAPEITSDLRRASPESDIYSLGCILHEMVGSGPRIPCNEIREDGPFGAIMRNCTRSDPSRRFRSVRSVMDAIMSAASGLPPILTTAASEFANKLGEGASLDEGSWRELIAYVEDHDGHHDGDAVLARLLYDQIVDLCNTWPTLADRLSICFAKWVYSNDFPFGQCDPLANILQVFINNCSFEGKSDALLALLMLGTSHNRWYVEEKFYSLCGPAMEDSLARRLAIEFRTGGEKVCRAIEHLEGSIGVSRMGLHPILHQTLAEICP
ncbi:serine/threonine-protein kinase [Komagataeibacter melomenusus]